MLKRAAITLLFVLLFFFSFSQVQVVKKNPITLFTVNKKPVTVEEFIYLYKKNHQATRPVSPRQGCAMH